MLDQRYVQLLLRRLSHVHRALWWSYLCRAGVSRWVRRPDFADQSGGIVVRILLRGRTIIPLVLRVKQLFSLIVAISHHN